MKKKLIAFVCFLLVSLSGLPQLPVRLNERPVVLNTSTGALKGKMVTPNQESGYPVVLIIPGSGLTDMDGNSAALPGKNNSLRYLAEGLAGKGIASLRYDKRGIASSASAGKDEYSMRFEDGIKDARGWIDYLSKDKRISGIYVLGHSEGALVGMAASVDNPKVKGYISVAGAGRPAYEIIEEQMAGQPEVIRNMVRSINTSLKEGKLVPDVPIGLQALFRSSVQPYMISWYTYNPQEIIKKFFDGMGRGYGSILGLIIAAGVFAAGLKSCGLISLFIDYLKNSSDVAKLGASFGPYLLGIITGSGNAAAFAFNESVTPHALEFGMKIEDLGFIACVSATLGRVSSPLAAGVILIAGIAGASPLDVVKRSIPVMLCTIGALYFLV